MRWLLSLTRGNRRGGGVSKDIELDTKIINRLMSMSASEILIKLREARIIGLSEKICDVLKLAYETQCERELLKVVAALSAEGEEE